MSDQTVNFSGRDFSAELERLLALLRAELPEYTDWNHSDMGVVLMRLLARETDQLNLYIDRVAAEGFLASAIFRQSLIELGGLVGYSPTLASPATTRFGIQRKAGVTGAVSIPKYTAIGRVDGLSYLTVEDVGLAASEASAEVTALQGLVITRQFTLADLIQNDWTGRLKLNLGSNVAAGSAVVSHGNPAQYWTEVDSFWRSAATDRQFLLELNGDTDEVWLVFGNGRKGAQPTESMALTVQYVRTDGAAGNCGHSTVYIVPSEFEQLITCSNVEPATGGAASEDIESIRDMIPRCVRTQRRGVTKADYEALLEHLPGVLHVQALDRNDSPSWPHLHLALYAVPDGGGPMSSLLKSQILAQCCEWGHLGPWTGRYILKDVTTVPINISVRIGVTAGYSRDAVSSVVRTAFETVMTPQNRTIGGTVPFNELQAAQTGIAGLSWIEFDAPTGDTPINAGCFPVPGVISIIVQS
jgi:hypothetical protein